MLLVWCYCNFCTGPALRAFFCWVLCHPVCSGFDSTDFMVLIIINDYRFLTRFLSLFVIGLLMCILVSQGFRLKDFEAICFLCCIWCFRVSAFMSNYFGVLGFPDLGDFADQTFWPNVIFNNRVNNKFRSINPQ